MRKGGIEPARGQGGDKPTPLPYYDMLASQAASYRVGAWACPRPGIIAHPALASLRIGAGGGQVFFRQPEGFFFGVNKAFGLGFGDGFQELADEGAGF